MSALPAPAIVSAPLAYESVLARRALSDVDLVVIHCTELPDLVMAREYGERVLYENGSGNSGHFYIDRDGSIVQYVALERVAHHVRGMNPRSVGIELVNTGRYPHWFDSRHQAMEEPYTPAQIQALIALLHWLSTALPSLRWIAGHEELDTAQVEASDDATLTVARKRDPGPRFPWPQVLQAVALKPLPAQSRA
ncbi:N-acetylmuramoyl-L-alanine amidase [Stenotrophomonas pictorum JCM 9942]|uniref:N-acetylmuramoyl-L-alanine amidase n=1 Tax=Stenotrophomonas pictorum JCM 9942 TaxID=1236960 RepID=A0A0R0ANW8_9GAMM|nr:N-acetylmuramoyl-L-alanine amidase [Stenotrophomonas pictorum]KRG44098.1 N-acetylmuramoyl-L-alanine amidase [Stenotrophomonas pictorum JCM 9942]